MQYLYLLKQSSVIVFLYLLSCEESSDSESRSASNQLITVTTTNVNDADIYYNFSDQSEVSIDDLWDFGIVKDTANYNMPSFVPGNVKIAIYQDLDFHAVNILPNSFNDDIVTDHSLFKYNGIYEVLSYDITVHKVSVKNPNYLFIIASGENVFKFQFVEYISGITVFHFAQINR